MVRWITPMSALAALLVAAGLGPASARAQEPTARAQDPAAKYLKWDPATKTVTFELIAGAPGAAKGPFNFDGYTDGEANLIVPPGSNIVMNFYQADGTPHSAEIIADKDPMPNMGGDPAIPRAYTNKVSEGLPQESRDTIRFTAPDSGSYRIFCGVPGHGLSGMWIRFTVDPAAKEPKFVTKPAQG
jgi:plastocyanin